MRKKALFITLLIATVYAILGILWIEFSDQFVKEGLGDSLSVESVLLLQNIKGKAYVLVTAVLLFVAMYVLQNQLIKTVEAIDNTRNEVQKLFNSPYFGIVILSQDGTILRVNNQFEELTGFTKDAIVQKHFTKIFGYNTVAVKAINSFLGGPDNILNSDFNIKGPSGDLLWLNIKGFAVDINFQQSKILMVAPESDKSFVNQQIKEVQIKQEAIINNTSDLIFSYNLNNELLTFNKQFEQSFIKQFNSVPEVGFNFTHLLDSNIEVRNFYDKIKSRLENSNRTKFLSIFPTELGTQYLDIRVNAILKKGSTQIDFITVNIRNVSEQHTLLESVIASHKKYKVLFDNSPQALVICSVSDLKIHEINTQGLDLFALKTHEIESLNLLQLIGLEHEKELNDFLKTISRTKKSLNQITLPIQIKATKTTILLEANYINYNEADAFLISFSDITLKNKMQEEAMQLIIEVEDNERLRIAKELHDGLTQNLTVSNLHLLGIEEELNANLSSKSLEKYKKAQYVLNQSIAESREIAHNLMPKAINNFGLAISLEQLISDMQSAEPSIDWVYYTNFQNFRLLPNLEVHLYRIVQEALQNILKHSEAKNASVQLIKHDSIISLTIEDDGVGFDFEMNKPTFGLNSIKTRSLAIGAKLNLDSNKNSGTCINIELNYT